MSCHEIGRGMNSVTQVVIKCMKKNTYDRKHHLDCSCLMEPAISHHRTSLGEWGEMAALPAERYCAF